MLRYLRTPLLILLLSAMTRGLIASHIEVLHCFERGPRYPGTIVQTPDGSLYVTAAGGKKNAGALVKVSADAHLTTLSFDRATGSYPLELISDHNNGVYGLTQYGPDYGPAIIFATTPEGSVQPIFGAGKDEYLHGLGWARSGVLYATVTSSDGSNARFIEVNTHGDLLASIKLERHANTFYGPFVVGPDQNLYQTLEGQGIGGLTGVSRLSEGGIFAPLGTFNQPRSLVSSHDGYLYGLSATGGSNGGGAIFRLTTNGIVSMFADIGTLFAENISPSPLVVGSDGTLYGSFSNGGDLNAGGGIFQVAPSGAVSILTQFDGVIHGYPYALAIGPDGNIYGTTPAGSNNVGTVFSVSPAGSLKTLAIFRDAEGTGPTGLASGPDGRLYGATAVGGLNDTGTVFALSTNAQLTTFQSFPPDYWIYIQRTSIPSPLVATADGNLYGTTYSGADDHGTLFRLTSAGEFSTVLMFNGTNGSNPGAKMVLGDDGSLYGTTYAGGQGYDGNRYSGNGTVFRFSPKQGLTTIASFPQGQTSPGELTLAPDHFFYGTSQFGGERNFGTIFRISRDGDMKTLYSFTGLNGKNPGARLVRGSDGALYGITAGGGVEDLGTVFRITMDGQFGTFVTFHLSDALGYGPSSLVAGSDGALYGATESGSQADRGAIFRLSLTGELSLMEAFDPSAGFNHQGMVLGPDNNLYGTSQDGGTSGGGAIFRVVFPRFLNITRDSDSVRLEGSGSANTPFQVWSAPHPSGLMSSGTLVGSGTFDVEGRFSIPDSTSGAARARFYRLVGL
jgi:uncharacterized repeat protein (TIGR03803 family)